MIGSKWNCIRQPYSLLATIEIQNLHPDRVYEWMKTGKWNRKDFLRWLTEIRVIDLKEAK